MDEVMDVLENVPYVGHEELDLIYRLEYMDDVPDENIEIFREDCGYRGGDSRDVALHLQVDKMMHGVVVVPISMDRPYGLGNRRVTVPRDFLSDARIYTRDLIASTGGISPITVRTVKAIVDRSEYWFDYDEDGDLLGINIGNIRIKDRRGGKDDTLLCMLDMRSGFEDLEDDIVVTCGVVKEAENRARALGMSCPSVDAILAGMSA